MAERLKAHAWKVCKPKGFEGSNPFLSANDEAPKGVFLLAEKKGEKPSGSKKSSGTINIRYIHVAYPSGHHTKRDVQNLSSQF